jgi:hypothetical protein
MNPLPSSLLPTQPAVEKRNLTQCILDGSGKISTITENDVKKARALMQSRFAVGWSGCAAV